MNSPIFRRRPYLFCHSGLPSKHSEATTRQAQCPLERPLKRLPCGVVHERCCTTSAACASSSLLGGWVASVLRFEHQENGPTASQELRTCKRDPASPPAEQP